MQKSNCTGGPTAASKWVAVQFSLVDAEYPNVMIVPFHIDSGVLAGSNLRSRISNYIQIFSALHTKHWLCARVVKGMD